ncbi:MAG: hypothetical protein OEZ43_05270 [Gammaproteobacteria bacterium]|nr:hypothetical protein [Gammaproteobacteria bacterium]
MGKHFGTTTYVSLNPPHIQDILADQSTCITPPRLVVSTTNNKGEISEGILKCINPCDESVTENEELWGRLTRLRGITIKTRTDGFIEAEAHFHKLKFVPPSDNAVLTFVDPLETPGKTQTWRFSPDFISKQFSKNMSCLESER